MTDKLQAQINRGNEAVQWTGFKADALREMRAALVETMIGAEGAMEREEARLKIHLLGEFVATVQRYINDGKVAQAVLDQTPLE